MATTFYPTNSTSALTSTTWTNAPSKRLLSLKRGSGVISTSDATIATLATAWANGAKAGVWNNGSGQTLATGAGTNWAASSILFITRPLAAFTLAGAISLNYRGSESSLSANYGPNAQLLKLPAGGGATAHIAFLTTGAAEFGTAEAAQTLTVTPTSTPIADGDALVLVLGFAALGGVSAATFTASGFFAGAAGATGDTFITFTETIAELFVPYPNPMFQLLPQ